MGALSAVDKAMNMSELLELDSSLLLLLAVTAHLQLDPLVKPFTDMAALGRRSFFPTIG